MPITNMSDNMMAVVTTGNGGYEKLEYCEVPLPQLKAGEVLIQVLAAGVNNTEINTRLGWYSASVTGSTIDTVQNVTGSQDNKVDGGWNKSTPFPIIQGTDCCGRVVAVGADQNNPMLDKRILVRPCIRVSGFDSMDHIWMASDFNGAFAQYVKAPAEEVFEINCDWSDAELASIPCAYGTAENMLQRANVCKGDHVLISGASGGVGSAAVQLALSRKAHVTAITSEGKQDQIKAIGANEVITRDVDLVSQIGQESVDVVVDNVAGDGISVLFKLIKRGGRYVTSGAIGGPIVSLDMRDIYLKDIRLIGCTAWDEPVFPALVSYIEQDKIKPLVSATFPLEQIVTAQKEFMTKAHVGKFVLIPDKPE